MANLTANQIFKEWAKKYSQESCQDLLDLGIKQVCRRVDATSKTCYGESHCVHSVSNGIEQRCDCEKVWKVLNASEAKQLEDEGLI